MTYTPAALTITKAKAIVKADNKSKTYDGGAFTELTATVSGLVNGDRVEDGVINYTLAYNNGMDADTYTITASGDPVQGNYDVEYQTGTLTINPRAMTLTSGSAERI